MSKIYNLKVGRPRPHSLLREPMHLSDLSFEDLYLDISDNWQEKARKLQARRWRRLRHQLG